MAICQAQVACDRQNKSSYIYGPWDFDGFTRDDSAGYWFSDGSVMFFNPITDEFCWEIGKKPLKPELELSEEDWELLCSEELTLWDRICLAET